MKKSLVATALLSALLTACSGGGGGGGGSESPSAPQNTPVNSDPTPAALTASGESTASSTSRGKAEARSEHKPAEQRSRRNRREVVSSREDYSGERVTHESVTSFNYDKENIEVEKFSGNPNATDDDRKGKFSNPLYVTTNGEKITVKFANGTAKGSSCDNCSENSYDFSLVGENGYYGYYNSVNHDASGTHKNYVYGVKKSLVVAGRPAGDAKYEKKNGFIYSLYNVKDVNSGFEKIPNYGDVSMEFKGGALQNASIKKAGTQIELFDIKEQGNVISMSPKSTSGEEIATYFYDRTELKTVFVDSQEGKKDYKYLFGTAKAEHWFGVLAAENTTK